MLTSLRTAADNAWTKIFSQVFTVDSENQLREMFAATECLERRDFTMLHRVVLGLVSKDLRAELEASTSGINDLDSHGRTALSMAAERNDAAAVKVLLEYGADPIIVSPDQGSALHFATTARGSCCISPLLAHGAKVESMTNWKQTALHYVAAYKNDERPARLLLEAGVDPNVKDLDGITPLQWAAVSGGDKVAVVLLEHGADPNNVDNFNNTALLSTIKANRHKILDLLVHHGASLKSPLASGGTILHDIARDADRESLEILERVDHLHLSPDSLDDRGLTALEVLQSREDRSPELIDAFLRLIKSHTTPTAPSNKEAILDRNNSGKEGMMRNLGPGGGLPVSTQSNTAFRRLEGPQTTNHLMHRLGAFSYDTWKLLKGTLVSAKAQRDLLLVFLFAIGMASLYQRL